MSHILSNTLTQIRNSNALAKKRCLVPWSGLNERFLMALVDAGFIGGQERLAREPRDMIEIVLLPERIHELTVVSTPGRRQYVGYREIPTVRNGLGDVVISTPQGIMMGKQAKEKKVGGEVICRLA